MHKVATLILFSIIHLTRVGAQQADEMLSVGMLANSLNSDLGGYQTLKPGAAISLKLNKRRWLNGQFQLTTGYVQASATQSPSGSLSPANRFVNTGFVQFHLEANINLIKRDQWSLFISQGFGLMRFTPKDEFGQNLSDQGGTRMPIEAYDLSTIVLPSGIGAHYFITPDIGFSLHIRLTNPQTDYLDNISNYGNPNNNDQVLSLQLSFLHRISLRKKTDVANP